MSYDSHKKGLLAATVGALVLGTLVLWGALHELAENPIPIAKR
jgi:hypothetical protein